MRPLVSCAVFLCLLALSDAVAVVERARTQAQAQKRGVDLNAWMNQANNAGHVCVSWGDTHIIPFHPGNRLDLYDPRPFLLAEWIPAADSSDLQRRFRVEATQIYAAWGTNTVDNDFAVWCGYDLVKFIKPRSGDTRPQVYVNDQQINPGGGHVLPRSPKDSQAYFVRDLSGDGQWVYQVSCNRDVVRADYASGFEIQMMWVTAAWPNFYGNARVEINPQRVGQMQGLCGGGRQFTRFEPEFAKRDPVPPPEPCVAKPTPKWQEWCATEIEKGTGVKLTQMHDAFKRLDADFNKAIVGFIDDCAADSLCGPPYNTAAMQKQVCGWVQLVKDAEAEDETQFRKAMDDCKLGDEKRREIQQKMKALYQEKFELGAFCTKEKPTAPDTVPDLKECPVVAPLQAAPAVVAPPPPPPIVQRATQPTFVNQKPAVGDETHMGSRSNVIIT